MPTVDALTRRGEKVTLVTVRTAVVGSADLTALYKGLTEQTVSLRSVEGVARLTRSAKIAFAGFALRRTEGAR